MKHIINLSDAKNVSQIGGKAAWLGKLLRAGVNVPDGFVVTTTTKFPLSQAAKSDILLKLDELGAELVAVRSSAANEDGAEQSFAGQFDTFLNVERAGLVEKITQVHNSATNERVASYSNQTETSIAIVVQAMVKAEIAGVAFSVNPVTNDLSQVVVEATRGLGEKLVSGLVTPDLYVVDKNSGEIVDHKAGDSAVDLSESQLDNLLNVVQRVETLASQPMDIEWAIAGDELFILQARPITTIKERT
jgi:pyruvate,water dikinase